MDASPPATNPSLDLSQPFRLGDWRVDPEGLSLSQGGDSQRLDARHMRLLLHLARRAGEVVSVEELLDQVWAGVVVGSDSVYQAVAALRRALGDDPRKPTYLATAPRQGYRLLLSPSADAAPHLAAPLSAAPPPSPTPRPGRSRPRWYWAAAALTVALLLSLAWRLTPPGAGNDPKPGQTSGIAPQRDGVAVLPFLDLTEAMDQEYFADGMTEQLIERLGKQPGLRVPARSLVFAYKGKGTPVATIAQALHVAYVLEGSVRRSGATVRVSAQLVRADTGFVVWTESYDRPLSGQLRVQDEIAAEVVRALQASLQPTPPR
jgi:TolB-like protein/DNA-binding winged helix-turn-helix (wHTH) protein